MPDVSPALSAEMQEIERRMQVLRQEIVAKRKEVRNLYRRLVELRAQAGLGDIDEDLFAEYMRLKERFSELSREPSQTNQFMMRSLSEKLERLEEELRRRGREV